jgi:alcohol dehydrogenase class IV
MDVMCHAVESVTARRYTQRAASAAPSARPASQGANPWSDLGCKEAMRLLAAHLERAVAGDDAAREQVMWAATLAGIAFGNAGVHAPHAMAYAVAGRVREFRPAGYPDAPLVPHGMAVAVSAPAVFRHTASTAPDRHREAAVLLGGDRHAQADRTAGDQLADAVIQLMRAIAIPNGISGVGYGAGDISALVDGTVPQQRLLGNAPCELPPSTLAALFEGALSYW